MPNFVEPFFSSLGAIRLYQNLSKNSDGAAKPAILAVIQECRRRLKGASGQSAHLRTNADSMRILDQTLRKNRDENRMIWVRLSASDRKAHLAIAGLLCAIRLYTFRSKIVFLLSYISTIFLKWKIHLLIIASIAMGRRLRSSPPRPRRRPFRFFKNV